MWYGLAESLAYPSGEEGGIISAFKRFLPFFPRVEEGGMGVGTLWFNIIKRKNIVTLIAT